MNALEFLLHAYTDQPWRKGLFLSLHFFFQPKVDQDAIVLFFSTFFFHFFSIVDYSDVYIFEFFRSYTLIITNTLYICIILFPFFCIFYCLNSHDKQYE